MRLTMEQPVTGGRRYVLEIDDVDLHRWSPTPFDRLLFDDIEHGPDRGTPVADHLLGLEAMARGIETAK